MAGSLTERRSAELTDREWFIQETFGFERCDACNEVPLEVRATVMVPTEIVAKKYPTAVALGQFGQEVIMRRTKERFLTVATHRACRACRKALFQMLTSTYPDSAHVQLEEPPSDKVIVTMS